MLLQQCQRARQEGAIEVAFECVYSSEVWWVVPKLLGFDNWEALDSKKGWGWP